MWKARAQRRADRISQLKDTIGELEARLAAVQKQLDTRRHATLNRDILRQILAARIEQLPVSAHDRAGAAARERRLAEASPAYAAAVGGADSAGAQRIDIDGLPWWVPLDPRVDDRLERAGRQGFPLRAILQTREVALGGVMLDLGANIGRTSIPRVLLGDVRAVYAAEPEPNNYACLVRNVAEYKLRGFVLPDQVAIGAERGEVELRRSRHIGGHRIMHRQRKPVETVTVQLWPVDQWMDKVGIEAEAVTFVKVDTQGSEVHVLRGARRLLARRHVAWQMEVDPTLLKRAGTPIADLWPLLETHFTHFVDVSRGQGGPRARPTAELRDALGYLGKGEKTDLLLYSGVR